MEAVAQLSRGNYLPAEVKIQVKKGVTSLKITSGQGNEYAKASERSCGSSFQG